MWGKFTWHKGDGLGMSRLDKFLISENFLKAQNLHSQYVGCRKTSDHIPIWLKCSVRNWGLKPFKFSDAWVDHKEFLPFVPKSRSFMNLKRNVVLFVK